MSPRFLMARHRPLALALFLAPGAIYAAPYGQDMDTRMQLAERKLQLVADLVLRIDGLEREVQNLRGQVESQQHDLEGLRQQQRDLYMDLEQRIGGTPGAPASAPAAALPVIQSPPAQSQLIQPPVVMERPPVGGVGRMDPPSPPAYPSEPASEPAPEAIDATVLPVPSVIGGMAASETPNATDEDRAYDNAFEMVRQRRFADAEAAFRGFIDSYPRHDLVANAHYWLAESAYAQGKAEDALFEFDFLARTFRTSPKASDALLKVGFILDDTQDFARAREKLEKVLREYPTTTAARLARDRLDRMAREGH